MLKFIELFPDGEEPSYSVVAALLEGPPIEEGTRTAHERVCRHLVVAALCVKTTLGSLFVIERWPLDQDHMISWYGRNNYGEVW